MLDERFGIAVVASAAFNLLGVFPTGVVVLIRNPADLMGQTPLNLIRLLQPILAPSPSTIPGLILNPTVLVRYLH